jgi:hypothetical protein
MYKPKTADVFALLQCYTTVIVLSYRVLRQPISPIVKGMPDVEDTANKL